VPAVPVTRVVPGDRQPILDQRQACVDPIDVDVPQDPVVPVALVLLA
jgi:hypothetical protein